MNSPEDILDQITDNVHKQLIIDLKANVKTAQEFWDFRRGSRCRFGKQLVRLLPHHFPRTLIFSDPKKDRLAEAVIPRPRRELYLANHHRLDPVAPSHFSGGQSLVPPTPASRRKVVKGTGISGTRGLKSLIIMVSSFW
jgi:hypothetical protein